MRHNRISDYFETHRLPQPAAPAVAAASFLYYPAGWQGLTAQQMQEQQHLYQVAFERARAASRPSLPERRLLEMWN